jgi:hypothetical protein
VFELFFLFPAGRLLAGAGGVGRNKDPTLRVFRQRDLLCGIPLLPVGIALVVEEVIPRDLSKPGEEFGACRRADLVKMPGDLEETVLDEIGSICYPGRLPILEVFDLALEVRANLRKEPLRCPGVARLGLAKQVQPALGVGGGSGTSSCHMRGSPGVKEESGMGTIVTLVYGVVQYQPEIFAERLSQAV